MSDAGLTPDKIDEVVLLVGVIHAYSTRGGYQAKNLFNGERAPTRVSIQMK